MDWFQGWTDWQWWLSAAALLGVAELFSMDLVLLMLAVGAAAGMVVAVATPFGFAIQMLAATAAAVAMLALVRPNVVKRLHHGPDLLLGHGKLVGRHATVLEEIAAHEVGRVKLAGEIWSAQAYDDTITIKPGETVEVFEIRGATVFVHPVPSIDS